jgi:hypothetical protein
LQLQTTVLTIGTHVKWTERLDGLLEELIDPALKEYYAAA